ncbi:MAG TPA: hypothetical protein H9671_01665 [Firmicutes bacterium]|nr:hypothetical protein [Bacillota bacterium]
MNDPLYFSSDGHLTDVALQILSDPESNLDELKRLEIAEHLSFCDACLMRSIDILSSAAAPPLEESMSKQIMKHIRTKSRVNWINQYISVGVAACFALLLWITGVFSSPVEADRNLQDIAAEFTQGTNQVTDTLSGYIQQFFDHIENFYMKEDLNHEKK